jgi:hypothetical protein
VKLLCRAWTKNAKVVGLKPHPHRDGQGRIPGAFYTVYLLIRILRREG